MGVISNMNKIPLVIILLSSLVIPAIAQSKAAPSGVAPAKVALPERYKKWLDEEVVYIITRKEREVFRQLQTDRERDHFVEAFWKQRDPSPGTPRNEFEEEHHRRLEHANKFFGRSTPLPGWKTDRGRIYITLGRPRNIEEYSNVNGVYPTEIWFYLGDPALGLPTAFNVIFFRKEGSGDYILYSPTEHGPRSLIASAMSSYRDAGRGAGSLIDDQAAYKALQDLEPNLARQTLSLIPGEAVQPGSESLASNRLMATIFSSPQKKVQVDYADALLKYKDFVEVEYTANYVSSEALVQVIRDESGTSLIHYTVEPAKISAEAAGGKYEVRFRLTGRVSDAAGRTVYQFDKDFPFSLTSSELDDVRSTSLSIQDVFPLVPGSYTFDILVKNVLSKEFTGAGRTVVVTEASGSVRMSPLLLAYKVEPKSGAAGERVPFKVGDRQLLCQGRKTFGTKDSLVLFFQLDGLTDELKKSGTLLFTFYREDKEVLSRPRPLAGLTQGTGIIEVQSLADFSPGYYQAKVRLVDGQGREAASAKEDFEISTAAAVPRPLVVSKVVAAVKPEDDQFTTGAQLLNKGDYEEARTRLADAYGRDPKRPEFAVAYSQALFRLNDFRRVREVLLPWADGPEPAAEVLAILGQACHALGEFEPAAKYYAGYITRFGMNIDILNYLGTCYFQLGNKDEALKAWAKSLELSPSQEKIRSLVESLKKK